MFIFVLFFHFFSSVLVPNASVCHLLLVLPSQIYRSTKNVRFEDVAIVQMNKFAANYSPCIQSDLFRSCKKSFYFMESFLCICSTRLRPHHAAKTFRFYSSEL